ncbi:hypothetical protein VU05_05470 [Desulfobulbus sp. F1]|nr:hypothetical protein [Desulfobulbus sp. F1]
MMVHLSRQRVTWFDRHRDFFVRQVFADFFNLMYSFQELYHSYCTCRTTRRGEAAVCSSAARNRRNAASGISCQ